MIAEHEADIVPCKQYTLQIVIHLELLEILFSGVALQLWICWLADGFGHQGFMIFESAVLSCLVSSPLIEPWIEQSYLPREWIVVSPKSFDSRLEKSSLRSHLPVISRRSRWHWYSTISIRGNSFLADLRRKSGLRVFSETTKRSLELGLCFASIMLWKIFASVD